jgi:hypothetical protein
MRESIELILLPHLLFTKDGANDFHEKNRMNGLRKARSKSWWNDKWRGFYYAFLAFISNEENGIRIDIQSNTPVTLKNSLRWTHAPVNHVAVAKLERDYYEEFDPELEGTLEDA